MKPETNLLMTSRRFHITLVISSLGGGGAERVMTLLAEEWVRRDSVVTLITLGASGSDHYELAPEVDRVALDVLGASCGKWDAVKKNFHRLRKLRNVIISSNPDAVISFMDSTNVLTLLATFGRSIPVVVSERIDPRHYPIAAGWNRLRRWLYPRAKAVVVQTESVAVWAREFVAADKVRVIANPIVVPVGKGRENLPDWLPGEPFILAMGRLDRQKGFDLLLKAYAEVREMITVKLVILGEGPERKALEDLVDSLGLNGSVIMPGRVKSPEKVLLRARLFVMSSRFEGFPNALLEAMAMGLPVISFDCPSGPADIIQHGSNGLLIEPENVTELAESMVHLLGDEALSKWLGNNARQVATSFSLESVVDQWEDVIS